MRHIYQLDKNCIVWNWATMTMNSGLGVISDMKWDKEKQNIYFKHNNMIEEEWTPVSGWADAISSYKRYIEMENAINDILLGDK